MTASTTHREPTRDAHSAIITAAERLFADQGIEGVSLREIMRAAGQRNTTSLQYHFGDRDGLLRALVEKHIQSISVRRDAILDLLASHKETSLRDACSALVQPLVAKLNDPDGGREFLQIAAQLVNRDNRVIDPEELKRRHHLRPQWQPGPLEPPRRTPHAPGTTGSPLHRRFAAIRFVHIEIGRRARSSPDGDHALFSSQLVDLSAALLRAEISEETQRLLDERPRRKSN